VPQEITRQFIQTHRAIASQVESLYAEVDKLAKKKPNEAITPFIAKKINHVILKTREQVAEDPFIDAVETVSVEPDSLMRFD
jgi:hypothetical protein